MISQERATAVCAAGRLLEGHPHEERASVSARTTGASWRRGTAQRESHRTRARPTGTDREFNYSTG